MQMSSCRNHPSAPGRRHDSQLRVWSVVPGACTSGLNRDHCWLLNSSFIFSLLAHAKQHPLTALSFIPTSPPKYPQFFWLVTGHLQDSTKPDRGDSQPFLWNYIQALLETSKSQKWKKKISPAETEHSIDTLSPESFLFYLAWLLGAVRSQDQGALLLWVAIPSCPFSTHSPPQHLQECTFPVCLGLES